MVGSGGPLGPNGPKNFAAENNQREEDDAGKDEVLAKSIGDEGDSVVLLCFFVIFLDIGFAFHEATRHPPFVNAEFEHHEQMHADEGEEHAGDAENVKGEKRESVSPAMIGPPSISLTSWPPMSGTTPLSPRRCRTPVGVLIERITSPVKAMPRVRTRRSTPTIQVSSRGYLNAPNTNTLHMWRRPRDHEV